MSSTHYRRGKAYAADMAVYTKEMSGNNGSDISRIRQSLGRAMRMELTERQREVMTLYYSDGKNMREIAELLNIHKSTVSRTISRGEQRLRRCLRYGAASLVRQYATDVQDAG